MNYATEMKQYSTMKCTVNKYLSKYVTKESRAIVIDAETLLSSTALVKGGAIPWHVHVINYDEDIVNHAIVRGHIHSEAGVSTKVLPTFKGTFDIIYLDYCGNPEATNSGYSPSLDLAYCADRLRENGLLLVTFSRRTSDAIEKANEMIPHSMTLVKEVQYRETVPMYMMIMTKGSSKVREYRDTFNGMYRERKTKRKRESVSYGEKIRKVNTKLPTVHGLIEVKYKMTNGTFRWFKAIVDGKGANKLKVTWVDKDEKESFCTTDTIKVKQSTWRYVHDGDERYPYKLNEAGMKQIKSGKPLF